MLFADVWGSNASPHQVGPEPSLLHLWTSMPGFWQPRITSVKKIVPRRPSMRYVASENKLCNGLAAKATRTLTQPKTDTNLTPPNIPHSGTLVYKSADSASLFW